MNILKRTEFMVYTIIFCVSLFFIGCETTTKPNPINEVSKENKTTENSETTNNDNSDKTEDAKDESSASTIETKEPEKYEAKVSLTLEAIGGENITALPKLEAKVAKNGSNKRMEFNISGGQKFVYLEIGEKNLLILPDKKQYAEINKEAVGFEVRNLMTPNQIVDRAKNIKGLKKVGEEKYNGRDAVKYEYSATTDTKSKAGEIDTKSYVFVDKETGLPLKTEIISISKNANVKGLNGVKVVTEMSDIKTEVADDLFKEPEGFEKIDEKQIRSQINLVFNVVGQFIQQMMQSANSK